MQKNVVVIGAGPGGLAAAMLLASHGYKVDVYEKQGYVGGRNSAIKMSGYTFDMGPTFLSIPQIFEELFQAANRNARDYMNLKRLNLMYELIFDDAKIQMTDNHKKMKEEIERLYPGNGEGYERFMRDTEIKMAALLPLLQGQMDRFHHYLKPEAIRALPHLSLGKTLYDVLGKYFTDEKLKLAFTFQSKYLGMSRSLFYFIVYGTCLRYLPSDRRSKSAISSNGKSSGRTSRAYRLKPRCSKTMD
jgi:phytoene desaturase